MGSDIFPHFDVNLPPVMGTEAKPYYENHLPLRGIAYTQQDRNQILALAISHIITSFNNGECPIYVEIGHDYWQIHAARNEGKK